MKFFFCFLCIEAETPLSKVTILFGPPFTNRLAGVKHILLAPRHQQAKLPHLCLARSERPEKIKNLFTYIHRYVGFRTSPLCDAFFDISAYSPGRSVPVFLKGTGHPEERWRFSDGRTEGRYRMLLRTRQVWVETGGFAR